MTDSPRFLSSDTKNDIINSLIREELSAKLLSQRLKVSVAAVRQHLDTLEALGLVIRRRVITQPSRPTFLYRLSPRALRALPTRYDLLLTRMIEVMNARDGPVAVADLVGAAAGRLAAEVRERLQHADPRSRWDALVQWFEEEFAWQADVADDSAGRRRITIHHCPFHDTSRASSSVCGVFFGTLIQTLYGSVPVEHAPAREGLACCSLLVGTGPA